MGTYTTYDFHESLQRVKLPSPPVECLRAWGRCNEGGTEWSGGFIIRLQDGQFAYISGWNDYTGWGCQDGVHVTYAPTVKKLDLLDTTSDPNYPWSQHQELEPNDTWDEQPVDINKYIASGMKDPWEV